MYDEFPWIKFGILSLAFMALIWILGKSSLDVGMRILFTMTAPVGVYFALAGKSLRSRG